MREVDALDGICGRMCDLSGVQYKVSCNYCGYKLLHFQMSALSGVKLQLKTMFVL
jgi:hypothetical protein